MRIVLSLSTFVLACLLMAFSTTSNAQCISGVEIESRDGFSSYTVCKDASSDVIGFRAERAGKLFAYAVVDVDNSRIKILTTNPFIDFNSLRPGVYRVYGINYAGALNAPGGIINSGYLASICSETSPNWITVTVTIPDAGVVLGPGGADEVDVCVGPGNNATLTFTNQRGVIGAIDGPANYAYLVTDDNDIVISVSTSGTVNFSNAGTGECRVYGFAYTGSLAIGTGVTVDWARSTGCSDVSGNYVTVNRQYSAVNAGVIVDRLTGATTTYACPSEDGNIFRVSTSATGGNTRVIITDDSGNILTTATNDFRIDNLAVGDYRFYSIAYEGELASNINTMNIASSNLASGCFDVSSNFVQVVVVVPDGGFVDTPEGTIVHVCVAGDGVADIVDVESIRPSQRAPGFIYVVTDDSGRILSTSTNNSFNFDGAGAGNCRIYGLSYTGTFNTSATHITDALSSECYSLSENSILVERVSLNAGPASPLNSTVSLQNGSANIGAVAGFGSVVPDLYEVAYILTKGDELQIVQVNYQKPLFTVTEGGTYRIHTVVGELNLTYSRNYLDLSNFIGQSVEAVIGYIADNNICGDIDPVGAKITVADPNNPDVNISVSISNITASPNPTSGVVNVIYQLETVSGSSKIAVLNGRGRSVLGFTRSAQRGNNYITVDLSDKRPGIYTIIIINGETIRRIRVAKVNN